MYEHLKEYATPIELQYIEAINREGTIMKAAKVLDRNLSSIVRGLQRVRKRAAQREVRNEDGSVHQSPAGFSVNGISTYYDPEGQQKGQWVKVSRDKESLTEFLEELTDKLSGNTGSFKASKSPKIVNSDLCSAYVIGDAHIGMYAYSAETGSDDFSTDIATRELRGAFNHLVNTSPPSQVGLIVNVGDYLHANDTTSLTPTSKNLLDTDGRYSQVIDRAVAIFTGAVDLLLGKHKEVWIVNARGNHDPDASVWINKVLEAYYRNEPRVKVLPNASSFHYIRWGNSLIGVHHGDKIKTQQLYEAMTRDRRQDWGECKFSYFWTGHIHHKEAQEIGGCLFESFNTLAPPDAWHAMSGYGANREMQQIILHKEHGIVARNICGIEMARLAA